MPSLLLRISLALTLTAALVALGPTPTLAQGVPNLTTFDSATRQSLELACIMSKSQGPAAYGHCLTNQINALRSSPGVPDLSWFDYTARQSLELACSMSKSQGPASYGRCLQDQIDALQNSTGVPELSRFDYATRQSLELACIMRKSQGPASYGRCLNEQINAFRNSPGVPSLSGLDYATRQSIEVTMKELKSGLHLGQMQVTKEAERVGRSVALSVLAYLLLVRWYGRDEAWTKEWSLFKRKERFIGEVAQDAVRRTELKWQRKVKQFQDVA